MDLAIALDSRLPQPLHQQIYEELRRAIWGFLYKPSKRGNRENVDS